MAQQAVIKNDLRIRLRRDRQGLTISDLRSKNSEIYSPWRIVVQEMSKLCKKNGTFGFDDHPAFAG